MATYKDICPFRVGDLVTTKPGYGYKLYTNGIESFTRKQTSGIVLPANDANEACDCFGTVYVSIAAGIKAAISLDCLVMPADNLR